MEGLVTAAWILTALGGLALVGIWRREVARGRRPGFAPAEERGAVTTGIVAPHAAVALSGLVLWVVAAGASAGEPRTPMRVLAIVLLLAAMAIGTSMFRSWRTRQDDDAPDAALPAALVYGHGLLAVVTLAGALIATIAAFS